MCAKRAATKSKTGPREKLDDLGPSALSNSELLALVFNVGTRSESVFAMASRVIEDYGEFSFAGEIDYKRLAVNLELSKLKSMQLIACLELGRRIYSKDSTGRPILNTPWKIFRRYRYMQHKSREELRAVYLDHNLLLIQDELLAVGSLNVIHCSPRDIIAGGLLVNATNIVLIHNHPSGQLTPSQEDLEFTERIRSACKIVGLKLLDHLIIAESGYYSLREQTG